MRTIWGLHMKPFGFCIWHFHFLWSAADGNWYSIVSLCSAKMTSHWLTYGVLISQRNYRDKLANLLHILMKWKSSLVYKQIGDCTEGEDYLLIHTEWSSICQLSSNQNQTKGLLSKHSTLPSIAYNTITYLISSLNNLNKQPINITQ